ncbi:hypothetical protein GOM71_19075 [Paenibacillus sp. NEAU-GSW1]|nr:hypothetical protein [Paenibacillus sp. NEAU-GSW1]
MYCNVCGIVYSTDRYFGRDWYCDCGGFILSAKEQGARLVIINHDPTPLDIYIDLVIHNRKIGDVLEETAEELMLK